METGRSSSVYSAYSRVRSIPRTRPSELTISVTTRPQPPWRLTRRRNAVSVMPAIGAMAYGEARLTEPIFIRVRTVNAKPAKTAKRKPLCELSALGVSGPVRFHIRGVHFDADGLADQVD